MPRRLGAIGPALLLAAVAGCGSQTAPGPSRLYAVADSSIVDADGEVLFLHGINVREDAKHIPEHIKPLTAAQVALIRDRGFDSVRLLTHWQALYPRQGQLDSDYLALYAAEVDKLAAAGLYVIVDMHQDLWGSPFSNGGAEWTCPEEIRAGYQPTSPWWLNYNSPQVRGCFDRFWADEDGIQAEWLQAWTAVAQAVCHQPRVIGFDLFNEPWPGSAIGDTAFDAEVLYPFYRRAMAAIEAVCPERIFFLEPSGAFSVGLVDPIQLRADDLPRAVIAPHFYPSVVEEAGQTYTWDQAELQQALAATLDGYLEQSAPLWIGEYGGLSETPGFGLYLEQVTDAFYQGFVGSALWAFNLADTGFAWLDAAGVPKAVFERAFAVPVPVRLPARPDSLRPDFDRRALALRVSCRRGRELEVALPAAGDWKVDVSPAGALELAAQEGHRLHLRCATAGPVEAEIAP